MNTLKVITSVEPLVGDDRVSVELRAQAGGALWHVFVELTVDAIALPGSVSGDVGCLLELARSDRDGVHFLLNCSCGQFACGGYYHGFRIEHQADGTVRWVNLDRPESPVLTFESSHVVQAVESAVAEIRARLIELRGQRIEFVCEDDAEVFGVFYDDAVYPGIEVPLAFGASEPLPTL